ncbi:alpha/beta hydrolase family protein, partial [Oenococcus oeni]|uniref:alpha/beta hydrolase family protein n=1 Tax=Oenococcus oeni TaxID=1247 RepID=UPI002108F35F
FNGQDFGDFSDIFSQMFGGSFNPNAPRKGRDLQYRINLTFEEAVFGKETEIKYVRQESLDLYDSQGVTEYWKRSPLAYAKNVKTPLLIQHGEWDMRCPIEQSEQFYTALKQNGNETKFIRYPQSFHGISRDGLPSL